jgi:phenylacetate-CoA ligase
MPDTSNIAAGNGATALAPVISYLETPLDDLLAPASQEQVDASLLAHVRATVERVPAYRTFLEEHGIDPDAVRSIDDVRRLPLVTKENYIRRYPLADLCRDGRLDTCDMVAVSSGSTGAPTFWPRSTADEIGATVRFEQIFHDSFQADRLSTLAVICFALGTWVGGMYTTSCCRRLAEKGYRVVMITPGNNRDEIHRVVRELGPAFDQVVLLGYPPFLKDVIDAGIARGIDWSRFNVKLVTAGEVFSEEWRALVGERLGSPDLIHGSASLYGTADAGVLGNETPLSITIRRWLAVHPEAARELFGESRMPTLVQYDPRHRCFEMTGRTLLFSGENGIPLVRYHIADTGGIISYREMMEFLSMRGFDPLAELGARGARELPFLFLFGRADFTVSYFGANIYPENISVGLEQEEVCRHVTGKFVLEAMEDGDRNRFLAIAVELAPGVDAGEELAGRITSSILSHLSRLNSEFVNYVPPEHRTPRVTLHAAGDPTHFPAGVKHRYTKSRRGSDE